MTQAFLDVPDFEFLKDLTSLFELYLFYLYNFIISIRIFTLWLFGADNSSIEYLDYII